MNWFNYYGLAFMAIIMVPNIVYAVKHKDDGLKPHFSKALIAAEQVGRYGCFALMIFNIPYTYFNFWFDHALIAYLSVNFALLLAYLIFWAVFWNRNGKLKAFLLSVIPSLVFMFSGIVWANIPLIVFAAVFGFSHIRISYKSVSDE